MSEQEKQLEILNTHLNFSISEIDILPEIHKAMTTYSQTQAVAFAEWNESKEAIDIWEKHAELGTNDKMLIWNELYQLFLAHQEEVNNKQK